MVMDEREQLKSLLESITDAFIIIDGNWRLQYVNRNVEQIFRDSRYSKSLIGKVLWEAVPELVGTKPGAVYRSVMQSRQPEVFESKSVVADVWVEVRVFPHNDGIAVLYRDITGKMHDHEELKKSEERFSKIFQSNAAAQAITNFATGKIIEVNKRFCELLGFERSELIDKTIDGLGIYDFAPPGEHSKILRMISENGKVGQYEIVYRTKQGEAVFLLLFAELIELHGENFIISSLIDVTEKRKVQEELIRLNDLLEERVRGKTLELTNSLEREKAVNDLKSQFVSTASHEFRTPLATILSSLALLEKYAGEDCGEKMIKHFKRIRTSVDNLTEILNDFLSLEKMEKGKTVVSNELFNLEDVIAMFTEEYRPNLKQGQTIIFTHEGEKEIFQDRKIVINALSNLISNACKYSGEGAVISVSSKVSGGLVKLQVTDCGLGIPENDQKHIFTLFYRAHNAETIQGTGLGLIIVKRYMELVGGNVTFSSRENEGSKFTLAFPSSARLF